jgi:hypothetical protein
MKKLIFSSSIILLVLLTTSCGVNTAVILNTNQNVTQVTLGANNFKVIDKVRGSAEVKYILLISGITHKQLYANAYAAMLEKANLVSGSKAIVNVVTEEHFGGVPPFYIVRTVTVSANVIEFDK